MRRLNLERRGEHGVTAVFIAMSMTLLLGAVGLGVDTTSLRYERSKFQHAADAAALAIGSDCANNKPTCADYQQTADKLTAENTLTGGQSSASSATVSPSPVTQASGQVGVTVSEAVSTKFFKVLGIDTKQVTAYARAIWKRHPISGPVIPFAVSMCEYVNTPVDTETLIDSSINGAVKDEIDKAKTDIEAYAAMDPYLISPACNVPGDVTLPGSPSQVTMLKGGLWLSDTGNSLSNGKLLSTQILQALESLTGYFQGGAKFGKYLTPGMTLMLAVYAPSNNYEHAGLRVAGGKADNPAQFDMRLVGYTPFVLSGWCFEKNNGKGCDSSGGAVPSSPGLAGMFVASSAQPPKLDPSDDDFVYGDAGSDFRAVKVELVD